MARTCDVCGKGPSVGNSVSHANNRTKRLWRPTLQRVHANVNGTITAMDNVCLHRGGPLGQGTIEGDKLVCPWHGWQWDPKTGEAVHDPTAKVTVYPLKIENGDVMVEI